MAMVKVLVQVPADSPWVTDPPEFVELVPDEDGPAKPLQAEYLATAGNMACFCGEEA